MFHFNWLPWQRPLRNQNRGPDRSYSNKYLSFGAKIAKISPVDPEIIGLQSKKERLRKVKYIARSASLPSGLKHRSVICREDDVGGRATVTRVIIERLCSCTQRCSVSCSVLYKFEKKQFLLYTALDTPVV